MKISVVEKSYVEKETNKVVKYRALIVNGVINGLPFEIPLKLKDDSFTLKKMVIDNCVMNAYDIQIEEYQFNGATRYNAFVLIANIKIMFSCSESDLYIIRLYNSLANKK